MREPTIPEINHRTIKLIVGLIALGLAAVTFVLSGGNIDSISASYHYGGWPRDVFVGALIAIGAFMAAYNGFTKKESVLSRIAALAAVGVALFPCGCGEHDEAIPGLHWISAAAMFLVLAWFCFLFRKRAMPKGTKEADRRAKLYAVCGVMIILSIVAMLLNGLSSGWIVARMPKFILLGEGVALVFFGIAWLAASHAIPVIASPKERKERARS